MDLLPIIGALLLPFLGLMAWALWPSEELEPSPSQPIGRGEPSPRPAPRVGLGAVVGVLGGKIVNSIRDAKDAYAATVAQDFMSNMQSGIRDDVDIHELVRRQNRNPEPAPAQNPARTGDDSPEYVIPLGRCQALETYYSKGGTAMELCRIQEGDVEAIRAALARQTTGKVVAKAAGGSYEQRLEQVRQARQGEG